MKRTVSIKVEVDMDSDFIKEWAKMEEGFEAAVDEALEDITDIRQTGSKYKRNKHGYSAKGCVKYILSYKGEGVH